MAIVTSWGELAPVFAGLGALMQTIASFAEHCERSPERGDFDPAEHQEAIRVLCCPRTEPLGDGKVRYFAEDYDYCSRVPGGVFLAPPDVRYGHVAPVPIYPAVEVLGSGNLAGSPSLAFDTKYPVKENNAGTKDSLIRNDE